MRLVQISVNTVLQSGYSVVLLGLRMEYFYKRENQTIIPTTMKMKTTIHQQWIVLFSILLLLGCTGEKPEFHLSDFQDPPETSKIYVMWFWVDKAISKEGITRDLEAMKEQGITGATIFNNGLAGKDFGVPQEIGRASCRERV